MSKVSIFIMTLLLAGLANSFEQSTIDRINQPTFVSEKAKVVSEKCGMMCVNSALMFDFVSQYKNGNKLQVLTCVDSKTRVPLLDLISKYNQKTNVYSAGKLTNSFLNYRALLYADQLKSNPDIGFKNAIWEASFVGVENFIEACEKEGQGKFLFSR